MTGASTWLLVAARGLLQTGSHIVLAAAEYIEFSSFTNERYLLYKKGRGSRVTSKFGHDHETDISAK